MAGKRKVDYNRLGFLVAILAIVVGVAIAYLATQTSWDIARASGSLRASKLTLGIGTSWLAPGTSSRVLVGAEATTEGKIVAIGLLPFLLGNEGDASVDDVTVTFRYHETFGREKFESLKYKVVGSYEASEVRRSFTKSDSLEFVSFRIPSLSPGIAININEPLLLQSTTVQDSFDGTVGDGTKVVVPFTLQFEMQFLVSTSARNTPVTDYPISVAVFSAASMQALQEHLAARWVPDQLAQTRRNTSFAEYLAALLFRRTEQRTVLVFPHLVSHAVEEGQLLTYPHG